MKNEGLFDMRTRAGRNAEVLAELQIGNRISRAWLEAIPQRKAAWHRLLKSGAIKQHRHRMLDGDDILIAEIVQKSEPPTRWQALVAGVRGLF